VTFSSMDFLPAALTLLSMSASWTRTPSPIVQKTLTRFLPEKSARKNVSISMPGMHSINTSHLLSSPHTDWLDAKQKSCSSNSFCASQTNGSSHAPWSAALSKLVSALPSSVSLTSVYKACVSRPPRSAAASNVKTAAPVLGCFAWTTTKNTPPHNIHIDPSTRHLSSKNCQTVVQMLTPSTQSVLTTPAVLIWVNVHMVHCSTTILV
jgi:hypothetical protein